MYSNILEIANKSESGSLDLTPNIFTLILSDSKILIIGDGCDIQDGMFSGINFLKNKNVFKVKDENDLIEYSNQNFDYIFIHGFDIREFNVNKLLEYSIGCINFCIDLMGEGYDVPSLMYNKDKHIDILTNQNIQVKILAPLKHYSEYENKYKNISFFKYDLGGPKIFCSRFNRIMIHTFKNTNQICMGLKWDDSKKNKLFMCLNGEPRIHRVKMMDSLMKNKLLNLGYVTFTSNLNTFMYDTSKPGVYTRYKVPRMLLDNSMFSNNRFGLHPPLSRDSYIEVVTESRYGKIPFKTEKCVKPFYNLQFPIILGHQGIVQDLRDAGFDMFDDIIDHSYDSIEIKTTDGKEYSDISEKTQMISNELLRLSNLDIHSLYLKNKDRFIYNQENLYNQTILNNNIHKDLAKFIFLNGAKVFETSLNSIEKIYI